MNKRVFCCGVLFGVLITWMLSFYLYYILTVHPQSALIKDQFQYLQNNIFNDDSKEDDDVDESEEQLHDNSIHHELNGGGKSYYVKDKFAKLRRKQSQKLINELKPVTISQDPEYGIIKNAEDQFIRDDGYKNHAFNCLVSNNIGVYREIPDTRHKL